MPQKTHSPHGGFTLLELAIVVTVIGLLVGGILVGKNLIQTAGIRADISQLEKTAAAINVFESKYDEMPGDITAAKATQFGFVGGGDGDGIIEENAFHQPQYPKYGRTGLSEPRFVFYQLAFTGLIAGAYDYNTIPIAGWAPHMFSHKDFYYITISTEIDDSPWFFVGVTQFAASNTDLLVASKDAFGNRSYIYTPAEAFAIDNKKDDGRPQSGAIFAVHMDFPVSYPETGACVNAGGLTYNVNNPNQLCDLLVRGDQ